MRTETTHAAINNVLLPGTILLANIDVTGLLEYALRAAAGGAIWLAYKIAADRLEQQKEARGAKRQKKASNQPDNHGLH
jgi:hypothetical protein